MSRGITLIFILLCSYASIAQGEFNLHVSDGEEPIGLAEVRLAGMKYATDLDGKVVLPVLKGELVFIQKAGYEPIEIAVPLAGSDVFAQLSARQEELNQVVVTGTRTHLNRSESTINIQVLGAEVLRSTQSVTAAEGLNFRPGLRVEYNCQNCGFSQVRLNGLDGPYTQILIDGRPVFSALSGVYGLEQIPSSMIERVEVMRGGGSSLYGANAIAGTINIITVEPVVNSWEVKSQYTSNGLSAPDIATQGTASWVGNKYGIQAWGSHRYRSPLNVNPEALYDRDSDGIPETNDDFSELTKLKSFSGGIRTWIRPSTRERWEFEARGLHEFRRGGNRFEYAPHEADIAEQLIHNTGAFNMQYEWLSKDGKTHISTYFSGAFTARDSYYGAGGNSPDSIVRARATLFYGKTIDQIANAGALISQNFNLHHSATFGIDAQYNHVNDEMPGYGRSIIQTVSTPALYAQWRWKWDEHWTSEIGGRYDAPNIISNNSFAGEEATEGNAQFHTFNPRLSFLYKQNDHLRYRTSYATGFRAPQAFNEDLHLSTLGGEARIVQLSPNLQVERSQSFNLGVEWDIHAHPWEGRVSVDGFYTQLQNPFVNIPFTGALVDNGDTIALLDTKVNDANGAVVSGFSIEASATHQKWTIQLGYTLQTAKYSTAREWYPAQVSDRIMRAPSQYGYAIVAYIPNKIWRVDCSATFTGSMITPNERLKVLVETPSFIDLNLSAQRSWKIKNAQLTTELGVYNLLNQYQPDVEVGWNRDASYFYGPIRPLSVYLGVTLGI